MAHFSIFCKGLLIERLKRELIKEKEDSIIILNKNKKPQLTCRQKYRHCCINLCRKLRNCCLLPENNCFYRLLFKLSHKESLENYLLKSVLGFIGGFCLTYILFSFLVIQLNFKLSMATMMCSILGTVLMLGLAFSHFIRCIVFLTLPQFFSKRGRQALLAYAFILTVTGPGKNTLNNMGILNESLACGQEQLKSAARQIVEVIKKPFMAIRDAIKSVVKTVKIMVKKMKEIFLKIKRIIMAIVGVIKSAFQFLGNILNICNKELGTPFQRCSRVFKNAIQDCNAKLGPWFNWLCSIVYLVESVCYIVKIFDYVCLLVDVISDSIIGVVIRKVKSFVRHIRTMFYVRIKFSHYFHFQTNSSKTYAEVATGIVREIKEKTQFAAAIFDAINIFASFLFLFLLVKVLQYRLKFLTCERFDNKYITKQFREIDLMRAKFGKETALPLNYRERVLYIKINSYRLVKTERQKLAQSAITLGTASIKMGFYIAIDYCLFWILNLIRHHARFQSKVTAPNLPAVHIEGNGILADLLKSVVNAFKPLGIELEIDTVPCLPNPLPPDFERYLQIGIFLLLCWILTFLEPYGLRLRHWIMCYYHPIRAKQRAVWLYNHIIRSRLSFLKFARRQLRRNKMRDTKVTFKKFITTKLNCWLSRLCFGSNTQKACFLCGEVFQNTDMLQPKKCARPECPGLYCQQCFTDLKNICSICLFPVDYGDMSDISEEKGSANDTNFKSSKPILKNLSLQKIEEAKPVLSDDSTNSSNSSHYSYTYQYKNQISNLKQIESRNKNIKSHFYGKKLSNNKQQAVKRYKKKNVKTFTSIINKPSQKSLKHITSMSSGENFD